MNVMTPRLREPSSYSGPWADRAREPLSEWRLGSCQEVVAFALKGLLSLNYLPSQWWEPNEFVRGHPQHCTCSH